VSKRAQSERILEKPTPMAAAVRISGERGVTQNDTHGYLTCEQYQGLRSKEKGGGILPAALYQS
jgi:hypothetical protein